MTFYDWVMAERAARERYYELLREAEVERMLRTRVPMRPKRSLGGFWGWGTARPRPRSQPRPHPQPQPEP